LHRLSSSFVLGYHGCDRAVADRLLAGEPLKPSANEWDWLGPGAYFGEANPKRGLEFAAEAAKRQGSSIKDPVVIGAVLDLGLCLDLTTSSGTAWIRIAHKSLVEVQKIAGKPMPRNHGDSLRRYLDCAVIKRLHGILAEMGQPTLDTVKGVFVEGDPVYPDAGFRQKTHVQIAVCNPECIKAIFAVPPSQLR